MRHTTLRSIVCFGLFVALSPLSSAAEWANQLFPVKSHDFGTVAVAAKTEYDFKIRNATNQDIHISNVRASCGCTTPILKDQWVKAGQEGSLIARFNTSSFHGKKGATLTVVIDRPAYAEVQLRVDGYIRRDIVFNPGAVEFGTVNEGEPVEQRVAVAYAGRSDWQILGVESPSPFLSVTVAEKNRTGQRIDYELLVKLAADAPAGFLKEDLIVKTNDRSMPRVPLAVAGTVEAPLSVSPQNFTFGELKPGEQFTQRLIVRSRNPFKVTDVTCEGLAVDFKAADEAKTVHVVSVQLTAGAETGEIKTAIAVNTDAGESLSAEAIVTGTVVEK